MEAVVVGTYNRSDLMEDSPVVPGSPYFIMTYDTAKKLTGITEQTVILAIKNSEGFFDEVLTGVQKIADKNEKIITGIKRISKPGLRVYAGKDELPRVLGGLGIAILSTNQGVITDKEARKLQVGGEVLAFVW